MNHSNTIREARVRSCHDVMVDLQFVREAAMNFIFKHGISKFSGPFDIESVCISYMNDPSKREEINRILGVR